MNHESFMRKALIQAQYAFEEDEIPVGAVVVCRDSVIATGYNQTERLTDVTAHAEMIALTAAQEALGAKFLEECRMYVTLEPCPMCAGALAWSRMGEIYVGALDEKRGYSRFQPNILHPKTKVYQGVLEQECSELLTAFFRAKR